MEPLKRKEKIMLGGVGAILPILISFTEQTKIELEAEFLLGYGIRALLLFVLGCFWIYINNDPTETSKWRVVQLGMLAPALITSFVSSNNLNNANNQFVNPKPIEHSSGRIFMSKNKTHYSKNSYRYIIPYIENNKNDILLHISSLEARLVNDSLLIELTLKHSSLIDTASMNSFMSKFNFKKTADTLRMQLHLSGLKNIDKALLVEHINNIKKLPKRMYTSYQKIIKGIFGKYSEENYLLILSSHHNPIAAKLDLIENSLNGIESNAYYNEEDGKYIVVSVKNNEPYFKSIESIQAIKKNKYKNRKRIDKKNILVR